jgi:uncharacterized protein (AIM24 family)
MERPRLLPTSATDETFAGVTYHLDRELVPVLTIELDARVIWLHGYGNVFEKQLGGGESIDVEPGGSLYKDPYVQMETNITRMSTGLLGGFSMMLHRFTGPGRVGLQSTYLHMPSE